jgi:hypothetical protein
MLKRRISKSRKFASLKNDKARLLYLLLLPHLDAEGRMEADAGIIKGTVCPYIKTLSQAGIRIYLEQLHTSKLIRLYTVDDEKYLEYARFSDFNRIDKAKEATSHIPTPPELQSNSGATPPEVKLNISKDNISKGKVVDFPSNLNTPEFLQKWDEWEVFRKESRKKLTPSTKKKQLKLLSEFSIDDAMAAIDLSIQNGWQGLFPERNRNARTQNSTAQRTNVRPNTAFEFDEASHEGTRISNEHV